MMNGQFDHILFIVASYSPTPTTYHLLVTVGGMQHSQFTLTVMKKILFFSARNPTWLSMARAQLYVCSVNNSFFYRGEVYNVIGVDFFFLIEIQFFTLSPRVASSLTSAPQQELKDASDAFDTSKNNSQQKMLFLFLFLISGWIW